MAKISSFCSRIVRERVVSGVTAEAIDKLAQMTGDSGPWKVRIDRALTWLVEVDGKHWRSRAARGRIYRFLNHLQKPDPEEIEHIRRAHVLFTPEKIEANREQNRRLIESLRTYIDTALSSDAEFFEPQIEIVRQVIGDLCDHADPSRQQDRGPSSSPARPPD